MSSHDASASSSAAASLAPTRNNTYDNLDSLGSAMQQDSAPNMDEVSRKLADMRRTSECTSALGKETVVDNPLAQLLAIRSFAALNCQAAPTLGPPAHQQGPLFPQLAALRTTSMLQRLPSSQR